MGSNANAAHREPWNKGKIVGQKAPFKLKDIWALRVRLQMESRVRELALFNLGIDSKLRGCDLVSLKVRDICHGDQVASRAVVMQHKTKRPVQFEITPATRDAVQKWIKQAGLRSDDFVFPSRIHDSPHLGTRQYARILEGWVEELGLDPADYGTHSMRRTKATLIYKRTKNLRTFVQCSCCSGTPSWSQRCATSALRSTMPWRFLSRLRSDRRNQPPGRRLQRLPGGRRGPGGRFQAHPRTDPPGHRRTAANDCLSVASSTRNARCRNGRRGSRAVRLSRRLRLS